MGFGSCEEPNSCLGFLTVPTICLNYNHCLLILVSLIPEQTVAMLQGHPGGNNLATRGHFFVEAKWTSSTCAIIFIDSAVAPFA